MNGINRKDSFIARLGIAAVVVLFTQQAFAAGTTAGTDIDNLATVDYEVNGFNQTDIESAPGVGNSNPGLGNGTVTTFEVDNRVDFSLTQVGGIHTVVTPGQTDQFVEFLLTNDGNSVQDFRLVATQLNNPDAIFGLADTDDDIGNPRIRVGVPGNPAGAPPTPATVEDWVDEIGEDESVIIHIYGDDLGGLVDGDVMNVDLLAVAAEGGTAGGGAGADLVDGFGSPDNPAAIDIVFSDGAGGLGTGQVTERHGFTYQSAGLNVSKVATVISDPFNNTTNSKAIPGAVVEYVITIANSGVLDADNVVITDAIDNDVAFDATFNGNTGIQIVNPGTPVPCTADGNAADGCELAGNNLTVGGALAITVTQGTSMVITYRVTIP